MAAQEYRPIKGNGATRGFEGAHPRYGLPQQLYSYSDIDGETLFFVASYEGGRRVPWSYDGKLWQARAWPAPFPLYGLDRLTRSPHDDVLILPDEATVAAYVAICPDPLAICCFGGAKGIDLADLSPLSGRRVFIWLAAGKGGRESSLKLAARLTGIASEIAVVDTEGEEEGFTARTLIENGVPAGALRAYARERLVTAEDYTGTTWSGEAVGPLLLTHEAQSAAAPSNLPADSVPKFNSSDEAWRYFNLDRGGAMRPWPNIDNVQRMLALHPQTRERYAFDEFSGRILCEDRVWIPDREASTLTTLFIRDACFPTLHTSTVIEGVGAYAEQRKRNVVREYLEGLPPWDGQERMGQFLIAAYGAADTPYTRACGRLFLVSAIARVFKPGELVRSLIVLEGAQKAGKTQSLHDLAEPWMLESSRKVDTKEFEEQIQGFWIVELPELAGMIRSDVEAVKAALTRKDDVYRAAYGRGTYSHPRQCVFVGTTNESSWQTDSTGGTRYLPIECRAVDRKYVQKHRAALWAEALAFYRLGACWWELPEEAAESEQDKRRVADAWEDDIGTILDLKSVTGVSIPQIMDALKLDTRDRHHGSTIRISKILGRAGWRVHNDKVAGDDGKRKSLRLWRAGPLAGKT